MTKSRTDWMPVLGDMASASQQSPSGLKFSQRMASKWAVDKITEQESDLAVAADLAHYCDSLYPILAATHPGKADALRKRYIRLAHLVEAV